MLKLISSLKPFRIMIFFIFIFIFGQAMAELALPTLMSDVVNNGMLQGDNAYIMTYGGYMLIVALGSTAFSITGAFLSAKVAVGVGRNLRNRLFTRVENYSLTEFDKLGTASLITRTTNDIVQIQTVLVMMLRFMIYAPVMSIGGIIMAVSRDKSLTVILLVVIPILITFMVTVAFSIMPAFKSMQKKLDRLNMVLRENLTGIRVIRAFNKLEHEGKRFEVANADLTDTAIKVNQTMALLQPFMIIILNITSIAITWFGGWRIAQGSMQVGDMMAFIQYAMQIMFSFIMVAMMFVMVPRAQASAERINEVFEIEPEIVDPKIRKEFQDKRGFVEFQNVSFSYPGAEEPALCNISFQAGPGEITAIIGGTGSGKTTLINLIPRFYDVCQGSILVDGVNITELYQNDLRSKIGFVPQSAILFSGSISKNIRYGKKDATDEEVYHAAEIAQASKFISEMPAGYDTEIAQGGTNVSGGQKQRLSIARALIRKPEIYIFDDSFSALDFKTDSQLRAALRNETKDAAVIIVAQRVSTVMDADRIIVLDDGEMVGMGTHKELIKSNQVYREIVSSQLSEEELSAYE
ncbi:MAG: ABC transporter ATP-binding protein [Eubacteriales bacterium]